MKSTESEEKAMSENFEKFKTRYEKGYITKATLRGWVKVNEKRPGAGITAQEYKEITGEDLENG